MPRLPSPWLRAAAYSAVYSAIAAALLAVFALYTRSDFLLTLANQIWACW